MMTVMVPDLLPATDEICALCLHVVPDLHEVRRLLTVKVPTPSLLGNEEAHAEIVGGA